MCSTFWKWACCWELWRCASYEHQAVADDHLIHILLPPLFLLPFGEKDRGIDPIIESEWFLRRDPTGPFAMLSFLRKLIVRYDTALCDNPLRTKVISSGIIMACAELTSQGLATASGATSAATLPATVASPASPRTPTALPPRAPTSASASSFSARTSETRHDPTASAALARGCLVGDFNVAHVAVFGFLSGSLYAAPVMQ